ncbi:hypothetical protein RhiirB3_407256 [Rhizophagus irregularis]|nr:hypothetical protein RhiirB3_407256 [Rhizophagus irregularis]
MPNTIQAMIELFNFTDNFNKDVLALYIEDVSSKANNSGFFAILQQDREIINNPSIFFKRLTPPRDDNEMSVNSQHPQASTSILTHNTPPVTPAHE